jgi:hypothetical protein
MTPAIPLGVETDSGLMAISWKEWHDSLERLRKVVEQLHGCSASYARTARVREVFKGEIVWNGEVEVFKLKGHPLTERCFAWAYQDDDGKTQYTTVLEVPPVTSPEKAVRAAIAAR